MAFGEIDGDRGRSPGVPVRGWLQDQRLTRVTVDGQAECARLLHFFAKLCIGITDDELVPAGRVCVDIRREAVSREAEPGEEPSSGVAAVIAVDCSSGRREFLGLA